LKFPSLINGQVQQVSVTVDPLNIQLKTHFMCSYLLKHIYLQILVLDEADRCLDLGFEATMNSIIENLPPKRQTLLFSATQTK